MKTKFNVDSILDFFYEMTSSRVRVHVDKSGLKHKEIHKTDTKCISRIIRNKRTRNNPYLINDSILNTTYKDDESGNYIPTGLVNSLNLSEKDILWGTDEEIDSYIDKFFLILWDNICIKNELINSEKFLCDYVPYAKYSTYWNILFNPDTTDRRFAFAEYKGRMLNYPALAFGISEDEVIEKRAPSKEEALFFLYYRCKDSFHSDFLEFAKKTETYHNLDNTIRNYITETFIPMLKNYEPTESSLGLRVENLIKEDLSYQACISFGRNFNNKDYHTALLAASKKYIKELEAIQIDFHAQQYPDSIITKRYS